jgi:hypothetical protein
LLQEATISNLIKQLSKAVSSYVLSAYVLKHNTPILNPILNIVVVDINVFSTLIVALTYYKLDRELVVAIELNRTNVITIIANLL